ncbi:MAG: hypothetical protein RI564_13700, partial [Gracilimonas sp.]|nr:hypothetical protein [Gracilimonas sp.]
LSIFIPSSGYTTPLCLSPATQGRERFYNILSGICEIASSFDNLSLASISEFLANVGGFELESGFGLILPSTVFARVAVTEWELNPKQSPGIRLLICQRLFYDIPSGIEEIAASFDFIF